MALASLNLAAAPASQRAQPPQGGSDQQAMADGGQANRAAPDVVVIPQCREQVGATQVIEVPAGKSRLLSLSEPITKLTIGSDGVAHAKLISPTSLYLFGSSVGSTNMILLGSSNRCSVYDVVVQLDPAPLLQNILSVFPNEKEVTVRSVGDGIVLAGKVSDAVTSRQIESMARTYVLRRTAGSGGARAPGGSAGASNAARNLNELVVNSLSVAAPQQVMLEVKVAEVAKTVLDQFGINFSRAFALADGSGMRFLNGLLGGQGLVAGSAGGTAGAKVGVGMLNSSSIGSTTAATTVPAGSATIGGSTTTIPIGQAQNATILGIDAQKQDGLVKLLAEPTVMAISGQEGSFLAGGKIFIPVVQNNGNGAVTYTLEEKEFGVSLRFRPTVLADGRINLQVNPEVSELSATGVTITSSATGATTVLPAFSTRKAATTVQLYDGQSFAIGGLMKNNVSGNINAFPFLGEIPVLGALFRSHSFQTDRSELVFVVTPRLVKALPADYELPTDQYTPPSRWDLYGHGKLEGRAPEKAAPEQSSPAQGGFEPR
ncbi:MAG TPA: type II and III secretion system protein family protein [Rhodocyclaceae bacterium]|nr:type II and III secretion system protein family protein [Rhodocyclaceae bacterium]